MQLKLAVDLQVSHDVGSFLCAFQKLEQLVKLLAPGKNSQRDAAMLENVLYEVCGKAVKENSTLGHLLRGPAATPPVLSSSSRTGASLSLPGALPPWKRAQLENLQRCRLPNDRRLTVSCSQVICNNCTLPACASYQ